MPTPDEDAVVVPPSPPIEGSALRSSCPPEDERFASRGSRADSTSVEADEHETSPDTSARRQMPTPEPDTPAVDDEEVEKGEHIEDASAGASRLSEDSPSPANNPDAPSEGWTAQSITGRLEQSRGGPNDDEGMGPRYLKFPPLRRNIVSIAYV